MEKENKLKIRLIELENNKNLHWKKYDAKMCVFPTLLEEDVRNICCGLSSSILLMSTEINFSGNYQTKHANTYIYEHLRPSYFDGDNLEFIVELCDKYEDLVRVRFHSRHNSQKSYIATVQFDGKEDQAIQEWFCTCASGSRTVACCAHITALLCHLGVMQGEIDTAFHPLSAARLLGFVDDSISNSDTDEPDDDINGDIDFDD